MIFLTLILLLFVVSQNNVVYGSKVKKIHISYPIEHITNNNGNSSFQGIAKKEKLTCFGNEDYNAPTLKGLLTCLIQLSFPFISNNNNNNNNECYSIWGSRLVDIYVSGSVEFFRLSILPQETYDDIPISLYLTRWFEINSLSIDSYKSETIQIAAEPTYICARENEWIKSNNKSNFSVVFHNGFLRENDQFICFIKTFIHILIIICFSSVWFLPYLASSICGYLSFTHGIKVFVVLSVVCISIVFLAPFMLTKKNRHLSKLYISYFFSRNKELEAKMVIKQHLPIFQAIFFSSLLICTGSFLSYLLYSIEYIDYESRNMLMKTCIGIASSWFIFFLCRSFERFFR
jgi:hypothetical protein